MDLNSIREEINRVDYEIVKLLNKRLELALRTKKFKEQVQDKRREQEVVDNIQGIPLQLVDKKFSKNLFESIIAECRGIQMEDRKLVGFQGEHGANDQLAVTQFADNFVPVPCFHFSDVVEGIKHSWFDLGMLPVENTVDGGITEVNDILIENRLYINGEIKIPPNYAILTLPDSDYRTVKVVYSHPRVLAQCSGFITRNNLEARPYYDAAAAARMLADTKPRATAAIASPLCSALYNLTVIKENVENDPTNYTRYLLLGKKRAEGEGNKCSIAFTTENRFGELYGVLEILKENKISIIRIESRPSHDVKGNYVFLVDFAGSDKDEKIGKVLERVEKKAIMYKLLGCYNAAK